MHDYTGMGWGMGWIWIIGLIGIVIAIIIVSKAIKKNKKSALDILNERFAKGEINENEYVKAKKRLNKY